MTSHMRLAMTGISKRFQGVQALDNVNFQVEPSEVMCLLGENGAGKSTLMKILTGSYSPDAGSITVDGQDMQFRSPASAIEAGISVVHQELDLLPDLSVGQNLFVGREPHNWIFVNKRKRRIRARSTLDRVGATFDVDTRVRDLSVVQRQLTMIARALTIDARILVMDEPSATLTSEELNHVFSVIREVLTTGCSVLYISHRLEEVFEIGTRATVLRDGKAVAVHDLRTTTEQALIADMIGGHRDLLTREKVQLRQFDGGLRIDRAYIPGLIDIIDLEAPRGSITGVIGLGGSGRTTLLSTLFGARKAQLSATLDGKPFAPHSPQTAINARIGLVPEDRKTQGLAVNRSIWSNLTAVVGRRGFLKKSRRRFEKPFEVVRNLGVRLASISQAASSLSGGNQQKVVLGKWLVDGSTVLLLDEPTRGLDVGAKADLFREVRQLANEGSAVLLASSEMPEVMAHCDRVYVLYEGQVMGKFDPSIDSAELILQVMIAGERTQI